MGLLDFLRPPKQVLPTRVRSVAEYEEVVLRSPIPVIVDVWSSTCAPCKKLEPILTSIATRFAGRVRVVEIGTADTEPALLAALEVRATPTLIIVQHGDELGRESGVRPEAWFESMLAKEFELHP